MSDRGQDRGQRGTRRWRRLGRRPPLSLLAALLGVWLLGSCSHLGYYTHSLAGGAKVLAKRRSVEKVLADPTTGSDLRRQLELAQQMRGFAVSDLHLPDNESYRKFAELGRPFAIWNVVAAPELSVAPHTWCFLIAGCVAYRGYFSEAKAEKFAGKMRRRGFDVDVGGVVAYSTAGWFADPLLDTFILRDEPFLAGLLFHELAHQRVYVKDDSRFNESFAMAVEEQGALRWLENRGLDDQIASYRLYKRWEREFTELVFAHRARLEEIYATSASDEEKRRLKEETFERLRSAYAELKASWGGYEGFDGWFERDLNNARLALIGIYHEWVPAFERLLADQGGDLEAFYAEVDRLARLEAEPRRLRMEALLERSEMEEGG